MNPSIKHRIAALGIAVAAAIAIQGTVSGAGDDAPDCQTWNPPGVVDGRYQHTWNPDDAVDGQHQHTWNPDDAVDGPIQHSWNPAVVDGHYQHTLNPENSLGEPDQHSWNPASAHFEACLLPSE